MLWREKEMNEGACVDFRFPDDRDDEEIAEAREQGRIQCERAKWRFLLEFIAGAKNPKLRLAAFNYLERSDPRTLRQIAAELGVSHMTVAREIRKVSSFRIPSDVTSLLG